MDESTRIVIKTNLERYVMRLEAVNRLDITTDAMSENGAESVSEEDSEQKLTRSSGKIVTDTIIAIFMSFLMHAPRKGKGRSSNFLESNTTIEEAFDAQI